MNALVVTNITQKYSEEYNKIFITFTGGEPLLELEVLEQIINKLKHLNHKISYHITTNGVTSKKALNFLYENRFDVTISADGLPKIQDLQRPIQDSDLRSSFFIEKTINYLIKKEMLFQVRTTLTNYSLIQFSEAIKYWAKLGVEFVHFEIVDEKFIPIDSALRKPQLSKFKALFSHIIEEAQNNKVFLINSSIMKFLQPSEVFCTSFYGKRLHFNPDGSISLCYKIQSFKDEEKPFIIGRYNIETGAIKYFNKHIPTIERKDCFDCSFKTICGSGCPLITYNQDKKAMDEACLFSKFMIEETIKNVYECSLDGVPSVLLGSSYYDFKINNKIGELYESEKSN